MNEGRTVYVVDDEEAIRRSLKLMLSLQGYAVTLFDSGASLLEALDGLVPGCLLLDIRMPGIDGLEVQHRLAERGKQLPTVVMTGHGDLSIVVTALRNGAVSFLGKPFTKEAATRALDAAFLCLEDPDAYLGGLQASVDRLEALSEVERAILVHLAAGTTLPRIAGELSLEASAVELGRSRILATLEVDSVTEALRIAFAGGLGAGDGGLRNTT